MISDEVMSVTREILVESLGVSPAEVKLESYLIGDLGAESIDFLDIFHLAENKLGIRVSEEDLAPELRRPKEDEEWEEDVNRKLTDAELDKLRERLPRSAHGRIVPGIRVYDIIRLVNVESLALFFEAKVQAKRAAANG